MSAISESIDVEAPVRAVYNQWTQFEEFPRFMEGVEEVKQLDETRLEWHAAFGGRRRDWEATIVEQVPDKEIAWRSDAGALNAGRVTFEALDRDRTRVNLEMEFEPEGFIETAGDALGVVRRRVENDLERFKHYIESRGVETGAWRGEVHAGTETTMSEDDTHRGERL